MFCPNCGKQLHNGATFCGNCGTKLASAPPAQAPQRQNPPQQIPRQQVPQQLPRQQMHQQPPRQQMHQQPPRQTPQQPTGKTAPAPKKGKGALIAVLAVVLTAAIAVGVLFATGVLGGKENETGQLSTDHKDTSPISTTVSRESTKVEKLSISAETLNASTADGVKITLSPFLFDYEDNLELSVGSAETQKADNGDWMMSVYNVELGDLHELNCWIDIALPFDPSFLDAGEDPKQCVAAKYFNEETGEWEDDLLYDVDTVNHLLIIHTDHLSSYGCFEVRNAGKSNAYISKVNIDWELLEKYVSLEQSAAALAEYAANGAKSEQCYKIGEMAMEDIFQDVVLKSANQGNDVVGNVGTALQLSDIFFFTEKYAKANESFWKKMGTVGMTLGAINLGMEIMKSDKTDGEIMTIYKDAGLYALSVAGDTTMGIALVGVTCLDKSIQSFGEAARGYVVERMENCYLYYNEKYNTPEHHARTSKEWREIVAEAVKTSQGDEAWFKQILENEIDSYSRRFFSLGEDTKYEIQSEFAEHFSGGRLGVLSKEEEEAMVKRYKERMYQRLSGAILKEMQNEYQRTLQRKLKSAMLGVKDELNRNVTLEISEELEKDQKPSYAGYYFRLSPLSKDAAANAGSWTNVLDKDGKFTGRMTVMGYILGGMPDHLDLYKTKKDLDEGKITLSFKFKFSYPKTTVTLKADEYPSLDEIVGYYANGVATLEDIYLPPEVLQAMEAAKEAKARGEESEEGCDIDFDPSEMIGQSNQVPFTLEKAGSDSAYLQLQGVDDDENPLAGRELKYDDKTGILSIESFETESEGQRVTVSIRLECGYKDENRQGVQISGQLIEEYTVEAYDGIRITVGLRGDRDFES